MNDMDKTEIKQMLNSLLDERINDVRNICANDDPGLTDITDNLHMQINAILDSLKHSVKSNSFVESKINAVRKECEEEKNKAIEALQNKNETETVRKIGELRNKYEAEIEALQREYEAKLSKEIAGIQNQNEDMIEELKNKLNTANTELESIKRRLEEYENILRPYEAMLEKLCNCESLSGYCETKSIRKDDRIGFMAVVGTAYSFAETICSEMAQYKRTKKIPITNEEAALIREINDFYRNKYEECTEDVLYLPQNADINKAAELHILFKREEMKDCENPSENDFKYVDTIYSPCFKRPGSPNPQVKAYVHGVIC